MSDSVYVNLMFAHFKYLLYFSYKGCASTPSGVIGNMLGGMCFKRLKLSRKGLCGALITGGCITFFIWGMFFVVSCDTSPIAGLNTPYPDGTETIGRYVSLLRRGRPLTACELNVQIVLWGGCPRGGGGGYSRPHPPYNSYESIFSNYHISMCVH